MVRTWPVMQITTWRPATLLLLSLMLVRRCHCCCWSWCSLRNCLRHLVLVLLRMLLLGRCLLRYRLSRIHAVMLLRLIDLLDWVASLTPTELDDVYVVKLREALVTTARADVRTRSSGGTHARTYTHCSLPVASRGKMPSACLPACLPA